MLASIIIGHPHVGVEKGHVAQPYVPTTDANTGGKQQHVHTGLLFPHLDYPRQSRCKSAGRAVVVLAVHRGTLLDSLSILHFRRATIY